MTAAARLAATAALALLTGCATLNPPPPVDLLNMITDAELAAMDAEKPADKRLPDLLQMAEEEDAQRQAAPTTGDYMDMAMWLAEEEIDKAQDQEGAAETFADKRSAAG